MSATLLDGSTVEDPRLGRIERFDPRSREFQIRALLDGEAPPMEAVDPRATPAKFWTPGPTLNQAKEGQCVAEACTDCRNGRPHGKRPVIDVFEQRREFYHVCQHRDPWAGCYLGPRCPIQTGPAYGGTSVLAGGMEGRDRGYWREVRWIGAGSGSLEADLVQTLRDVGGIVFGVPWLDGMYDTSPDGLVDVSGRIVGGHAIHGFAWVPRLRLPKSFKGTKPAVAWHNSWGDGYGVRKYRRTGVGFILLDDLLGLLERGGEGMVPLR